MAQNPETEPPLQLYTKRPKSYPKAVKGRFRRLKWLAIVVTLGIYYLAPFIRWDRGPNAPDQAILIDLPNRRAYWFFIEIWPQEIYYIAGILIFSAIALFFVTSLLGRVWCGYFCPQTVWTDLFVWVEEFFQGDRNARMKLDKAPWSFDKIWRKAITHFFWVLIALGTAGAFVFYFNDAPSLWADIIHLHVSPTVLGFMAGLTGSTYLMAGYAREQVCIYMCPYSRFQSAMFDTDTLIIGYDEKRGEPRGKHKKGDSWEGKGHCIDCTQCVQVCPVGIDIREGLQIACIACGLCIDACDDIMDKVELPRGLIRYDSERALKGGSRRPHLLRPRTYYYSLLLALVGALMLYSLLTRSPLEVHALHDRNPLFVTLSDGDVRNGYEIKILNKGNEAHHFTISVDGLENAKLNAVGAGDVSTDDLTVPPDDVGHYHVFIRAPAQKKDNVDIVFTLKDNESGAVATHKSFFVTRETER